MRRQLQRLWVALTCISMVVSGCSPKQPFYFMEDGDLSHYIGMATKIESPDVDQQSLPDVENALAPITLSHNRFDKTWDLPLEDAVGYALRNSKVMRTFGARVASQGSTVASATEPSENLLRFRGGQSGSTTVYDPAIQESDPTTGVEGALSAFDAQVTSSVLWDKTDRPQNVASSGVSPLVFQRVLLEDRGTFNAGIQKRTTSGGLFALTNQTIYDSNNNPTRAVPSDWTTQFEASLRQPLLQGAGTMFNRIAGPVDPFTGSGSLTFDGVLINRINMDIRLSEFESEVRDLVGETEDAYWNLYFAYRNLEARRVGRDSALETWRKVHALSVARAKGGEADKEAQAREQYFSFRAQVEQGLADLYRNENRLRFLMGLAATDNRLIRPKDEPTTAPVAFDWNDVHTEAMCRSPELREQKWRIKQDELALLASKNFLMPRLDVVARYRWFGMGDKLIDKNGIGLTADPTASFAGTDAVSTLLDGNFQESEVGLQGSFNLGFRRELTQVRHQQLILARDRAVLQDAELELSHQITDAVRNIDTFYVLSQTLFSRRVAAEKQVEAVKAIYDVGQVTLDLLLEAQRRRADAESAYYRTITDYTRAITTLHWKKNSLLEYNGVYLAEGPWPAKAYFDAHRRARQRDASYYLDYGVTRPSVFSRGPTDQMPNGNHTAGAEDGTPTEVSSEAGEGEEITTPQDAGQPRPLKGESLPAPRGAAPSIQDSGPNQNGRKTTPVRSATRGGGTRLGATNAAPANNGPIRQRNQASGDHGAAKVAFDWGLDESTTGSSGVRQASANLPDDSQPGASSTQSSQRDSSDRTQRQQSSPADSSTGETDRSTPGWKKSQR